MVTVSEIMGRRPLVWVSVDAHVDDAQSLALREGIHHLLVEEGGEIVGLLCVCDLRDAPVRAHVAACMSRPVVFVDGQSTLEVAAQRMRSQDVGCLPIMRGPEVVGVITRGDLRRHGVPAESMGHRECAACGDSHHVRDFRDHEEVAFCKECLDTSPDVELGVGD